MSYSVVTVEDLDVPDWPAGSLLSKYTMIMAKKKEVYQTNDRDASAASFQLLLMLQTSLSFTESTAEIEIAALLDVCPFPTKHSQDFI